MPQHEGGLALPETDDVDPRIAATGGARRLKNPKSNYEWPGMMAQPDWLRTTVHEHTSFYGCAKCGQHSKTPHAVYTHLDKRHPAPGSGRLGGRVARVRRVVDPTAGSGSR
jgi:hypothetical protein